MRPRLHRRVVHCRHEQGLRFYSYAELLAHPGEMPPPVIAVETCCALQDYRWVYDFVLVTGRPEVIYTCGDASLRGFNWRTCVDRELKPSTEAKHIYRLVLSGDGRHLACCLAYR
ncbi:MAG: hypothetical protein ABIZ49_13105, partial [Opitutaceae bacterium]